MGLWGLLQANALLVQTLHVKDCGLGLWFSWVPTSLVGGITTRAKPPFQLAMYADGACTSLAIGRWQDRRRRGLKQRPVVLAYDWWFTGQCSAT